MRMNREAREELYDPKKVHKAQKYGSHGAAIRQIAKEWKEQKEKSGKISDPASRKSSAPPKSWFSAMYTGIKNRSDVRNPAAIVNNIWKKLTPQKRAQIKSRELKGEHFKYDLPLPVDMPTKGIGTVRTVKPFNLGEVQVNVNSKDFIELLKSKLFSKMKRNDGTIALVKRCKSNSGNVNLFVDRMR